MKITALYHHLCTNKHKAFGLLAFVLFVLGEAAWMNYFTYNLRKDIGLETLFGVASFISLVVFLPPFFLEKRVSSACVSSGKVILQYALSSFLVVISWFSGLEALKFLYPTVFSVIVSSIGLAAIVLMNTTRVGRLHVLACLIILGTALPMATSHSSVINWDGHFDGHLEMGVFFAVVCGISIFLNSMVSKRLEHAGHSFFKINAIRSMVVSLVCVSAGFWNWDLIAIKHNTSQLVTFSFILFIAQVGLLLAIKKFGLRGVAIGASAIPVGTLLVQFLIFETTADWFLAALVTGNALALMFISIKRS